MFSSGELSRAEKSKLKRDVEKRRIVQVRRGYYETAEKWASLFHYEKHRLKAIALANGLRSGALTGVSAATVLGLPIRVPMEAQLEVVGSSKTKRAGTDTRRMLWLPGEAPEASVYPIENFHVPVTSPRFFVAQLARSTSVEEAVVAMDHCLHAGIVSRAELDATVADYKNRINRSKVALAVSLAEGLTESPMETRLRLAMLRAGFSNFLIQPEISLYNAGRIIRPDFFFPSHLLIVEYDGFGKYSSTETAVFDDMARMHAASNSGLSFLRVNKHSFASGEWLRDLNIWLSREPVRAHGGIEIRGGKEIVNRWV